MYKFIYLEDCLYCPKYVGTNVNSILLYVLHHIAYILTGSMEQNPSWETNWFPASPILWNPKFHNSIHKCLPPVPILSPYQWINPGLRHQFIFHKMIRFYDEQLFAPHPTTNLQYYPLSAVRGCLFNIFTATLHIGGHVSIHNLKMCHAVASGFHLSWLYYIVWWIYYNKWFRRCIVIMYIKHYCFLSSWYVSFLPSSGKVIYHASQLPLQVLCF